MTSVLSTNHNSVSLLAFAAVRVYGLPPYFAHVSSNSWSSISAPLFLESPVSSRLSSHISRSFLPATRSNGSVGVELYLTCDLLPIEVGIPPAFRRFRRSCSDGRMNGTRKYLCACSVIATAAVAPPPPEAPTCVDLGGMVAVRGGRGGPTLVALA